MRRMSDEDYELLLDEDELGEGFEARDGDRDIEELDAQGRDDELEPEDGDEADPSGVDRGGDDDDEDDGDGVDDDVWPEPHPAFAAHFTDPIYTDWADDFAPFGGDEASDALAELYEEDLAEDATLAGLAEAEFEDDWPDILTDPVLLDEYGDAVLIALGFGLIRVTGAIDDEGRSLLAAAILRRGARHEDEEAFATMADDLERFDG